MSTSPGFDMERFAKEFNIADELKIVKIVSEKVAEGSSSTVHLQ